MTGLVPMLPGLKLYYRLMLGVLNTNTKITFGFTCIDDVYTCIGANWSIVFIQYPQ